MPRWYKSFQCGGIHPEALNKQIESLVQRHDLVMTVPAVRFEKRSNKRGFYLFLAIESTEIGEIPDAVRLSIFRLSTLGHPVGEFTLDQIRSMVGAEYGFHSYVRLIPYTRPIIPPASNPFEETGAEVSEKVVVSDDIAVQTQRYDRLLGWLSATGHGSWQVLQNTWQILGGKDSGQQVLRKFRLLGHMETSADGKRWATTPPVILPISSGDRAGQYVLSGRRDTKLLQALQHSLKIEIMAQEYGDGPATVYLHAKSPEYLGNALRKINQPVHQIEQAGLKLARLLPSLDGWKQSLEPIQGIRPHAFKVKRFNGIGFTETDFTGASGFYELWSFEGRTVGRVDVRPEYTLYYDAPRDNWLRADWYGLRFLARYDVDQSCLVQYNFTLGQIAIPLDWRWPEIYERALVLSSGRLPSYRAGWLVYEAINLVMIEEFSRKFNLDIQEISHA